MRLKLLGLHAVSLPNRPVKDNDTIHLKLASPPNVRNLSLRVVSTRYNATYAMDTDQVLAGDFQWPSNILTRIVPNVRFSELGAVACTRDCGADGDLIAVRLAEPFAGKPDYELLLTSERALDSISLTIEGPVGVSIMPSTSRYYPADHPIRLKLGSLGSGRWTVVVKGRATDGTDTAPFTRSILVP